MEFFPDRPLHLPAICLCRHVSGACQAQPTHMLAPTSPSASLIPSLLNAATVHGEVTTSDPWLERKWEAKLGLVVRWKNVQDRKGGLLSSRAPSLPTQTTGHTLWPFTEVTWACLGLAEAPTCGGHGSHTSTSESGPRTLELATIMVLG